MKREDGWWLGQFIPPTLPPLPPPRLTRATGTMYRTAEVLSPYQVAPPTGTGLPPYSPGPSRPQVLPPTEPQGRFFYDEPTPSEFQPPGPTGQVCPPYQVETAQGCVPEGPGVATPTRFPGLQRLLPLAAGGGGGAASTAIQATALGFRRPRWPRGPYRPW